MTQLLRVGSHGRPAPDALCRPAEVAPAGTAKEQKGSNGKSSNGRHVRAVPSWPSAIANFDLAAKGALSRFHSVASQLAQRSHRCLASGAARARRAGGRHAPRAGDAQSQDPRRLRRARHRAHRLLPRRRRLRVGLDHQRRERGHADARAGHRVAVVPVAGLTRAAPCRRARSRFRAWRPLEMPREARGRHAARRHRRAGRRHRRHAGEPARAGEPHPEHRAARSSDSANELERSAEGVQPAGRRSDRLDEARIARGAERQSQLVS